MAVVQVDRVAAEDAMPVRLDGVERERPPMREASPFSASCTARREPRSPSRLHVLGPAVTDLGCPLLVLALMLGGLAFEALQLGLEGAALDGIAGRIGLSGIVAVVPARQVGDPLLLLLGQAGAGVVALQLDPRVGERRLGGLALLLASPGAAVRPRLRAR